jgi:hypothetical protein
MNMPSLNAEATLTRSRKQYRSRIRPTSHQGIIPQSRLTCAFKAGRLAGRCLQRGFDHQDCMELAADFDAFCNARGL